MDSRHPNNRNLTFVSGNTWNGLPLLPNHCPFVYEYLVRSLGAMNRTVGEFRRVLVVRFDLRFPDAVLETDSECITRLFKSLKAKLYYHQSRKAGNGLRIRRQVLRYIWAKERNRSERWHYHVVLLLNGDAHKYLGRYGDGYQTSERNLASRIIGAWASALRIGQSDADALVHFPVNATYHLNANEETFCQDFAEVFQRISYLAKAQTKPFGDGSHHFGCSQQ